MVPSRRRPVTSRSGPDDLRHASIDIAQVPVVFLVIGDGISIPALLPITSNAR